MALTLVILQMLMLSRVNKNREEEFGDPALYTRDMRRAEMEKGDRASFFRYSI